MKKYFVRLFVVPLLLLASCQVNVELSDAQEASIISEVKKQYSYAISNLSKLDMELWSIPWSEDGFLSVNSGANYFPHYIEFKDSVEYWFSLREAQNVEILEERVTVLNADLALLTSTNKWEIQFKDETQVNVIAQGTLLWKKDSDGWKIIHLHESWR